MVNTDIVPIYVVLFSNNGSFSKLIRKATGSDYSHATITLDPSLNDMYSFSDIPLTRSKFILTSTAGFTRESIYGPMYAHNLYFTVLICFVTRDQREEVRKKIEYFKKNWNKYQYNDIGLIQYYFNKTNTNNHDERKKFKWFCSEFVSYMLNTASIPGFDDIMEAPQDLKDMNFYADSVDYTIPSFKKTDLILRTKIAKQKFLKEKAMNDLAEESVMDEYAMEGLRQSIATYKKTRKVKVKDKVMIEYTPLMDWETIHNHFVRLFGIRQIRFKFDMVDMILRRQIIQQGSQINDVTTKICKEMSRLASCIKDGTIEKIIVDRGILKLKGKIKILYPSCVADSSATEAIIDIEDIDPYSIKLL